MAGSVRGGDGENQREAPTGLSFQRIKTCKYLKNQKRAEIFFKIPLGVPLVFPRWIFKQEGPRQVSPLNYPKKWEECHHLEYKKTVDGELESCDLTYRNWRLGFRNILQKRNRKGFFYVGMKPRRWLRSDEGLIVCAIPICFVSNHFLQVEKMKTKTASAQITLFLSSSPSSVKSHHEISSSARYVGFWN